MTNQLQYARPADTIIYMADGRVVESGTYDELMQTGGGFAQLMSQTEVRRSATAQGAELVNVGATRLRLPALWVLAAGAGCPQLAVLAALHRATVAAER